jgi:phospholipase C
VLFRSMTGFRIPGVAISPFTRGGGVHHMTVTHESILKLMSYRFGLGHLTKRHRFASNIGRSFNFANPNYDRPELPDPEKIAATPCSFGGDAGFPAPVRAKEHDLTKLETSGLLERLGYEVQRASADRIYRNPDAIRRAVRESTRVR